MTEASPSAAGAATFTHPLHGWPTTPPPGYLGQLSPEFQSWMAEQSGHVAPEECGWYHTTELPDGTLIVGHWDLRGRETNYLGNLAYQGKRVLELGPASGQLTYFMERQGAAVTCFEVGYDCKFEFVPPIDGTDLDAFYRDFMPGIAKVNNSWWVQHELRESKARIAYGDIYNLPADLGEFDIAVFGSILLHLRDPFRALQQAAAHTTGTMVVTDKLHEGLEDLDDPVLRWGMQPWEKGPSQIWWNLSPGAITRMLWRLGFGRVDIIYHQQKYHEEGHREREDDAQSHDLFTIVASRSAHQPGVPRKAPSLSRRVRSRLGRISR